MHISNKQEYVQISSVPCNDVERVEISRYDSIVSDLTNLLSKYNVMLTSWFSMILAIITFAAIGPMFKYMEVSGVPPFLAASWRCQTMLIFLIPLAIIEHTCIKNRPSDKQIANDTNLSYPVYIYVAIAAAAWSGNLLTWIYSLQYTTTVRASLVASLHPLFLVFVIYFSGGSVSRYEWLGVVLSIAGLCVVGSDGFGDTGGKAMHRVLFGDALNLVAAMAQVVVILNRRRIKNYVPLFQV